MKRGRYASRAARSTPSGPKSGRSAALLPVLIGRCLHQPVWPWPAYHLQDLCPPAVRDVSQGVPQRRRPTEKELTACYDRDHSHGAAWYYSASKLFIYRLLACDGRASQGRRHDHAGSADKASAVPTRRGQSVHPMGHLHTRFIRRSVRGRTDSLPAAACSSGRAARPDHRVERRPVMSGELWLEVDDDPDPRDAELLNEGLYRYNRAHTGFADGSSLGVFLRDREGIIVGGAYGYTWGGCLDVKYLWVEDQLRHSGYGTRLLRAAEQAAA